MRLLRVASLLAVLLSSLGCVSPTVLLPLPDNCEEQPQLVEDRDGDGWSRCDDCDDGAPSVHPYAPELCDGIDNDCDPATLDDHDGDGDGWGICQDCDDTDPDRAPGFAELGCSGVDEDCDPATLDGEDRDGDGSSICRDCDDEDPDRSPGHREICDGIDNDCSGDADDNGACPAVLVWSDYLPWGPVPDQRAPELIGGSAFVTDDPLELGWAYDSGDYNVLAISHHLPWHIPNPVVDRLHDALERGMPVIVSTWAWEQQPVLAELLEVVPRGAHLEPRHLSPAVGGQADLWTLHEELPLSLGAIEAGDINGTVVEPAAADGWIAARFDGDEGAGAIAVTRSGRAIVNSFLSIEFTADDDADGVDDILELYVNELVLLGF